MHYNDKFNEKKVVMEFSGDENWGKCDLDYTVLQKGEMYAIKLTVDNEFDKDDRISTMFKRLDHR